MNSRLIDILNRVGKNPVRWTSPDGSELLVLPYGGRILGLFPPVTDLNFFWTHPALDSVESARAFYQSSDWHNSGGDRTWLSPEIDFFFPNYPSLDTYFQPREFDPGAYECIAENGDLMLQNSFTSKLSRSRHTVRLQVTKRLASTVNPLRNIASGIITQLEYSGFTLHTRLEILGSSGPAELNLWSLLQLPHGGELIIPTTSRAPVIHFMGETNPADLEVTNQFIRYKMRANGEQKIGVSSEFLTGRVGYLYGGGTDPTCLVIRNIVVDSSARYLDAPWTSPNTAGAAVQACNVNSKLGAFSELEYHAPAIGGTAGPSTCDDFSQVWAFYGPNQAIVEAARLLLYSKL